MFDFFRRPLGKDIGRGGYTRAKTVMKEVALTGAGNFVIDVPVSRKVLQNAKYTTGEEFTHMRYTAATCGANEFPDHYSLRQRQYKRYTKVALVMTMYNEDDDLFTKSMLSAMKNIAYLCSDECQYSWGPDGWKNFVVVVVSDGRAKINPRVLTVLGVMGCYADNLAKASVNGKDVTAHIFEYTTQVGVDRDLHLRGTESLLVPTQVIFVLKEKNAKKINSHRWFFNAICKICDPEVTLLLDVGTKPTKTSFYHLYRAFESDPNVGGACGEIAAELGSGWRNLLNPLVATQNFEYKMSNILDKPLESVFGYISVLPGAFSAYRYQALEGAPLDCYFKGETMHGGSNIFAANMYLAEDRILCFELVTKRGASWLLRYVKSARAETDVPDALPELISQRRRWLNGSFFAAVHATSHWSYIFRSGHGGVRKFWLCVEFLYNAINLMFSWFSIANFYLAFVFLFDVSDGQEGAGTNPETDPFSPHGETVFMVVRQIYIFAIVAVFISSLGNRPQGSRMLYYGIVVVFALIMCLMLFMGFWSIYLAIKVASTQIAEQHTNFVAYFFATPTFRDIVISLGSTYGLYFVASIMHLDPWHCFSSMFQYLILLPVYINIFMIYAFCNLHDVSWGTKGDNAPTLEAVVVKKTADGKQIVEVEMPVDEEDVDDAYTKFLNQLEHQRTNKDSAEQKVNAQTAQEDYFKEFRTRVVLLWVLTNCILILVFTNKKLFHDVKESVNPYLTFLFWSVAILSLIRFTASAIYMGQWWMNKIREAGKGKQPVRSAGGV
ncbi:Chitin synthase, class 1 [Rhizophlyctis rosea]|uniref:Chitin synthase n=1 Tax=Rhizophlyctis rosea TaxID=64517 RepID=A0AAD5SIC2_9FUNG|nr:Chitin synthase, class 1 [Rhizophlyctis rosea]